MVAWAKREKIDASDIGIGRYQLRDLVAILQQNASLQTILFTGGNSKNGPEYFFRRNLKEYGLKLKPITTTMPRVHQFQLDRKSTRLNSSHVRISYAVFCLKKKNKKNNQTFHKN